MRIAIVADESELASQMIVGLEADGHSCLSYESAVAFTNSLIWQRFDACVINHKVPGGARHV